jgi:transglutaminase-like putative cysteine protease
VSTFKLAVAVTWSVVCAPAISLAAEAPAWLQQAASVPASPLESGASAVVLVDDVNVTVSGDGRITTRRTYAVRVLARGGAEAAAIREVYTTDSGNVRTMRGWLLVDGHTTELGRAQTADLSLADNDVYNESRLRMLAAPDALVPGTIFGAETEVVEKTVFTQFDWTLQDEFPVRSVRRTLSLPSGWDARAVTFNHAPIPVSRNGTSYVWAVNDIPALVEEPSGPPASSVAPRLAVTYLPVAPTAASFGDWAAVSRWLATLADPQSAAHATLTAKSRELTGSASSEFERVRAIGRYVQGVQYISIQTGIGRGGGYKPRTALEVFTRNYGDCKDKANLMRTLLAAVGLRAYLVTIYSGDPDYVRSEWPSPQQFNHAIVAVALQGSFDAPAVLDQPGLGRLLFFDPTDEQTPVGQLPRHLQGSRALIVSSEGGPLVRMPLSSLEANRSGRRVTASVTANGALSATMSRVSAGDQASTERYLFQALEREEYGRRLEADVRRQIPGATLALGTVGDDPDGNRFEITMKLAAPAYAQVAGRLLIVRPPQMLRLDLPILTASARKNPILLEAREERDVLDLTPPAGATVDELPPPRSASTAFGEFSIVWRSEKGQVFRELTLRIARSTLPPESYQDVRAFLESFREAEQLPVVLALP